MLVLSRKSGEKIIIADNITISVLSVQGNRVRLGIDAPGEYRVLRAELAEWNGPVTTPQIAHLDLPVPAASCVG
jgi:carbon storage regulator